jgi:hypothetical protein
MKNIFKITPLLVLLAVFLLINEVLGYTSFPNYGIWTGIRPLEEKISKLRKFAKNGDVDAVVIGSSIGDFGFSAELYSQLMTQKIGRPYRAFNFSTGGAELTTIPALMTLAFNEVRPKELILILPAQYKRPNSIGNNSPDYTLSISPVAEHLQNQRFFPLQAALWNLPVIEKSAALRDLMTYGHYRNLKPAGMDTYEVTTWGDRIAFGAIKNNTDLIRLRKIYEQNIKPFNGGAQENILAQALDHFFPALDVEAMKKIKKIANQHHVNISVFASASAATLLDHPSESATYRQARREYFTNLAAALDAKLIFVLDSFAIPNFGLMEDTHLNTHGAAMLTRALFSEIAGTSFLDPDTLNADGSVLDKLPNADPTINNWAAVFVVKKDRKNTDLTCEFVQSIAVPPFPASDLKLAMRMADGIDRIAPARKIKDGIYAGSLNLPELKKNEVGLLRLLYQRGDELVAIPSPLASCRFD